LAERSKTPMMSDLSDLLGELYGRDPDGPPVRHEPAAEQRMVPEWRAQRAVPDWADEDELDRAFASWRPGPPADAPAAERADAAAHETTPTTTAVGLLEPPADTPFWAPEHDDILPARRARLTLRVPRARLRLRTRER